MPRIIILCIVLFACAIEAQEQKMLIQPQCQDWLATISNALLSQQQATILVEAEKNHVKREYATLQAAHDELKKRLDILEKPKE